MICVYKEENLCGISPCTALYSCFIIPVHVFKVLDFCKFSGGKNKANTKKTIIDHVYLLLAPNDNVLNV